MRPRGRTPAAAAASTPRWGAAAAASEENCWSLAETSGGLLTSLCRRAERRR